MKEKKKVAFIITNLGMGGAENMLVEQLTCLDRSKFEIYVITLKHHPKMNVRGRLAPDLKLIELNFRSVLDIVTFYKLWSVLRREKIEAVVTTLFNANLFGRIAAILARVPTIVSSEVNVYVDKNPWQIVADRILAKFTKKIIASSNEVIDFTSKQEQLPRSKFELNFNAIPLKLGEIKKNRNNVLTQLNLPLEPTYIVTAGSLTPQKGQTHLIDAVYKMKQEGVEDFKVLIFGKGPLKEELLEQIKSLGLENEVLFTGIMPIEDVMAISDVFTLPSLWEGLSIALLNAMDARCPIVATKVSGTTEALKDGASALLVTPGDSRELADAFKKVLSDSVLRQRIAEGGKKEVERFSIEKNVKVIENLIWP